MGRTGSSLLVVVAVQAMAAFGSPGAAHGASLKACHGFGCWFQTDIAVDKRAESQFAALFSGARSAKQERQAVARAVSLFEKLSTRKIGIADRAKSSQREHHKNGQMDCIDESTNTRGLLLYLQGRKLLRHHSVASNFTRGMLVDGRYPHSTAVLVEKEGERWVVDSWYEAAGGTPDIMLLDVWRKRGVMGER